MHEGRQRTLDDSIPTAYETHVYTHAIHSFVKYTYKALWFHDSSALSAGHSVNATMTESHTHTLVPHVHRVLAMAVYRWKYNGVGLETRII